MRMSSGTVDRFEEKQLATKCVDEKVGDGVADGSRRFRLCRVCR